VLVAGCFATLAADAQETKVLSPIVVTATRTQQDSFDLPMAIDKVMQDAIQDAQVRMNLSESLARVPGITAPNRGQMSSDPQISSRGFGSRSTFGTRGVRVYVDGIPISNPDGLGNPGNIDLGIVGGIEVMRGPFSALYGNSSAGVIQLFTEKAPSRPTVTADFYAGNFDTRRSEVKATGTHKGVEYLLDYSDFSTDGYRAQSKSRKEQATAKFGVKLSEDTKLTTLINWFDQFAQDPGGLTAEQVATDRRQAAFNNRPENGNARVYRGNQQIGFNLEKTINANNTINLIAYGGSRFTDSYIATGGQAGRLSSIDRKFYGAEARWTNRGNLLARPYTLSFGASGGYLQDDRTDTSTTNGIVTSASVRSRNELQKAYNFDLYAQGLWAVANRWDLHAGVRQVDLRQKVNDYLPNLAGNGTGVVNYSKVTPVAGVVFKATPVLNFYANAGRGFETPTMIEISFRDTLGNGPNLGLKPSTNTSYEIGSKWLPNDATRVNLAFFDISTDNEIVVSANSGAYTTYSNAAKTRRHGVELAVERYLTRNLSAFVAYSMLDAKFDESYISSTGAPVNKDNQIPGTYKHQLYAELAWRDPALGLVTAIEGRHNSKIYTNDVNSATANGYTIFNLRASLTQKAGKWNITEYARIENIFDKEYIGAVRVNDGNARFYEPAPRRNFILGVRASYVF
jgi:iron complex outermembrane receptor protein